MKNSFFLLALILLSTTTIAQNYERNIICEPDTINVDSRSMKTVEHIRYKAIWCTQVSKFGLRLDVGFNHTVYNVKTKEWLGNHNGSLAGLTVAWGDLNLGAKIKLATVHPIAVLDFNGEQLTRDAKINPVKCDFNLGYSINLKHNISIEPYIALTMHDFKVLNEEKLGKKFNLNKLWTPSIGTTIHKYFQIDDFQFINVFVRYGYGFADFKKVHNELGYGYSDLSLGIGFKGFIKRNFLKKI